MRILIAGPPKTGNVWIENILSVVYELEILDRSRDAIPSRVPELTQFVLNGGFREQSIFHQHFGPGEELFQAAASTPFTLVTPIRNPYDTFVSLFFYIQRFGDEFRAAKDPGAGVIGKRIDEPEVLTFIEEGFDRNMRLAVDWIRQRDRTVIVRYEDLHTDPLAVMKDVTESLAPVPDQRLETAIQASEADVMRRKSSSAAKHIRAARVGDWRSHLTDRHVRLFRSLYADMIAELGYEVL